MRLRKQYLTKNDCYRAGRTIRPQGVMVHSTGANNPSVARYVPGDDVIGRNQYGNDWDRPGVEKCAHAFVGRFADGSVGTVQTLPWNRRGWHCGRGKNGSANDTHISFEICEDGLEDASYFKAVYQEAVELTAMLCREHNLDPLADGVVICHKEGYHRGIASNHSDVLHWFPKFGKTMDDFRGDVAQKMRGEQEVTYEQWKEYMDRYLAERAELPASMPKLFAEANELGLTDGTRPMAFVTREESAVMARAAALK
ncbi:N-acetylmuramoyl-L-alanine amidase [Flintibacter sp. HCN-6482]|uniref:peptidoglycan recognition protein family protein n=1 Tax=Flintibacter sp. HCN-6482 TaxID=3134672 RepID=UPI0030BA8D04